MSGLLFAALAVNGRRDFAGVREISCVAARAVVHTKTTAKQPNAAVVVVVVAVAVAAAVVSAGGYLISLLFCLCLRESECVCVW